MKGWLVTEKDWHDFGVHNGLTTEQAERFASEMFLAYEGAGRRYAARCLQQWRVRESQPGLTVRP